METIKAQFAAADGRRSEVMKRAQESAAYTIPAVMPPTATGQADDLLRAYQALGADGISNLVSKLVLALFAPNMPWFRYKAGPKLRSDVNVTPDMVEAFDSILYARELQIQSKLDGTRYRARIRCALEQLLICGNSLSKLTKDYVLKNFRLDRWVQKRGTDSNVLWLITREQMQPAEITDEIRVQAGLDQADLNKMKDSVPGGDPRLQLYTKADRQSDDKWVIRQEMNEKSIGQPSEELVNPYIPVGYIEIPGEDWSRSFVEERLPDLRSLNGLSRAILEGAAAAAKIIPVADETKGYLVSDFMKGTGVGIAGRVNNGVVDGMGFVKVDKNADFSVALQQAQIIEKRLGKQMLLESATQPKGERVTAYQIMRIARELEGALGGIYSAIADELQRPLLERVAYQMERDKLIVPIPEALKDAVEVEILTGLEALGRQVELSNLSAAVQMLAQFPGALEAIKLPVLVSRVFQGFNVDFPALVKTAEEMQAEREAMMEQQLRAAAGQQAIQSVGKIAEGRAVPAQEEAAPAA